MTTPLVTDTNALRSICHRHHIRRLAIFGSVAQGTARPDSDIDLLVEFDPRAVPGLLAISQIETELSPVFGGRNVDLRTLQDLSPHFRGEVARTAIVQYAA